MILLIPSTDANNSNENNKFKFHYDSINSIFADLIKSNNVHI